MAYKAWKHSERRAAKVLGGQRTPLSGGASLHTRGDVIHPQLFVEVKHRKRFAVLSVMRLVEELARLEKKLPVLVLHEAGSHNSYYVLSEATLRKLVKLMGGGVNADDRGAANASKGRHSGSGAGKLGPSGVSGEPGVESRVGSDNVGRVIETERPPSDARRVKPTRRDR